LISANLYRSDLVSRKSSHTAESLESHKYLIKNVRDDLEAHLQSIDDKVETIVGRAVAESDEDATELRLINEERLSTQRSLQICAQLSEHINQIQVVPKRSNNGPEPSDPASLPERVINDGLVGCKNSLAVASAKLEEHMRDVMARWVTKSRIAMTSKEDVEDLLRLQDEWETARQCREICFSAGSHLNENINVIENNATGNAFQVMVTTNGKTLHGKNQGTGWIARQIGGDLSDTSVQQISRDMASTNLQDMDNESLSARGNTPTPPDKTMEKEPISQFRDRFGPGFKLTPKPVPDVTPSPIILVGNCQESRQESRQKGASKRQVAESKPV
jgi:hypothetical protein